MTIGIDGRLWDQTGVGRYIRNLVINLSNLDKKNSYVLFVRQQDFENVENQDLKKLQNWKVVQVDIPWHSLKEQLNFSTILEKHNLDLMHFPYFSLPIFYKKPFVVTIHDIIMHKFSTGNASTLPFLMYLVKKMGYKVVINKAVRNSVKIIVPLNSVKEDLVKDLKVDKDKIEVTYEGVDPGLKGKSLSSKEDFGKYFLYVGNAYPHKNLEKLIFAFKIFSKSYPETKLLLVGKYDYFYKKLETIEKEYSSIIFLYKVSDNMLSNLYKNAISLVSASLSEGFGLPALEAISNNCPVILSDIPSFREVCKNLPLYFDPENETDIAAKMEEVYKNKKNFYLGKSEKINEILDLFTWEKMAKKTLSIYESSVSLR